MEYRMESWKRTLALIVFAQVISSVGFSVFFPFLPSYIQQLGTNTSISLEVWSGVVFGGQALAMAITAPIWGSIADRRGRKPMLLRALFGGSIIILLMGFARSAEELAFLRAIQGAVTGTIAATNALVAASVPREKIGQAMSYLQVGLWGGVALGPLIGGVIADTFGFQAVFELTAVLLLISGLLITFGVKEQFTPPDPNKRKPSFMADWQRILGAPYVTPAYLVRFLDWLGNSMLLPFLPLFILTVHVDQARINTFTGFVVGISSATGTIAALVLGPIGDRIGHRTILLWATAIAALVSFPHAFVTDGWQLLVLQAIQGAALGAMGPALSSLLARYTTVGDSGAVFGLDSSITAGSRAIAPLLGAATVTLFGLRGLFVFIGISLLIALLITFIAIPEKPAKAEQQPEPA
jgi:DHA1 family multidrug resistance protein-like MFS transporter